MRLGYRRAAPHQSTSCFDRMMAAAACGWLRRQYGGLVELPLESAAGRPDDRVSPAVERAPESVAESYSLELPQRKGTLHRRLERPQAPLGQPVTAFATVVDAGGVSRVRPTECGGYRTTRSSGRGDGGAEPVVGTHVLRAETNDAEPADAELTVTDDPSDQVPPTDA